MIGQLDIFECFPELFRKPDPEVGEWVEEHGPVICHIMREGCIGHKVVWNCGTESMPNLCRVGILEKVLADHYYEYRNGDYIEKPCDRVILYTGKKQRSSLLLMPGREIYEVHPWSWPRNVENIEQT